jgi:hypothetical protein
MKQNSKDPFKLEEHLKIEGKDNGFLKAFHNVLKNNPMTKKCKC